MLSLLSPAKINLFLRVIRRRDDGYHDLASLFQAISLYDILNFKLASDDILTCSDSSLSTGPTNLVTKAVQLFKRKTDIRSGIAIHLEKYIPQQAGLGGGSSNAATTLWALNQLFGQPASESELAIWGAEIGSDVPFFLSQGTAYCTGRGELLRSMPPLMSQSLQIVKPVKGLSTPLVYQALNATLLPQRDPEKILKQFFNGFPDYFNDLEEPAFFLLPELATLKAFLIKGGFSSALMSGSGSSFFCIGDGKIPEMKNIRSFPAHFINRPEGEWFSLKN